MILSLERDELARYVARQLDCFFYDGISVDQRKIAQHVDTALSRAELCFSSSNSWYFWIDHQVRFNHLNGDQYAMFLYLLSNTLYKEQADMSLCEKLFCLNKLLNGIDAFYEIELPDIFLFCHPLGSVLGRASYSNFLLVYQQCTIGVAREAEQNVRGIYPTLGKFCSVYKGASILGDCHVGDKCKISAHSLLLDQNLGDNLIYIGTPRNYITKKNHNPYNIWRTE